jgi:hypothetical protein
MKRRVLNMLLKKGKHATHYQLKPAHSYFVQAHQLSVYKGHYIGSFNHPSDAENQAGYYYSMLHDTHAFQPAQD